MYREPTEQEWAVVGRYLAGRMVAHSLRMDGTAVYRFRGLWPELRGRTVFEAVTRAMAIEDEERERELKGGA